MNVYFDNSVLLQNTLLPYFCEAEPLKLISKLFYRLDYEKYNTHLQPHGILEIYYIKTKTIECKIRYKNGKLDGLHERWYGDGKMRSKETYKNGKLNGSYEAWYSNGILLSKRTYINDREEGLSERWYDNGQLWKKVNYKNGKQDGLSERWYENGKPHQKVNYKNGKQDGLCELWSENDVYEKMWYRRNHLYKHDNDKLCIIL
jgi:antitoxin component YwqK of YwqJK toxin-antitoxin module